MALKQSEKITVGIGAAIVLIGAFMRLAPAVGASSPGSVGSMLGRMNAFTALKQSVEKQQAELHIEFPTVGPAEQEAKIREELGKLVQSGGLKLGPLKRIERANRNMSADFQFDASGQYDQTIKFLAALESDSTPFKVLELHVENGPGNNGEGGGGNRGGGGGEGQANGQVHSTIKVRSYLFPKVFVEAKKEEKKPGDGAPQQNNGNGEQPPPPAQAGPVQGDSNAEKIDKKENKPKGSPSPTPAGPPSAATKKTGRTIIRADGHEAIIEGNKITVDGKAMDVTPEQLEKMKKQIPANAEVIEE